MLHKPEKISLIRLCRNLPVRCSVLFQIHQMLFQTELSPIQDDKGITRDDKIKNSQPCLCLCYLCLPAVFEPLRAVKDNTVGYRDVLGNWAIEFKVIKIYFVSPQVARKQALVQNWIASLLSMNENPLVSWKILKSKMQHDERSLQTPCL